jgi:predicted AlkP superfamily pyrophosphatase or phosphodiesterase
MKMPAGRFLLLPFLLLLTWSTSCQRNESGKLDTYVVMVSFDGFRWDYTDLYDTPNFDALAGNGVKAEKLIPSFPTKTFPNHYTLVTGLYPDHHGIINNAFYANDLGKMYRIGDREMVQNGKCYFGEPIWVTAERQGIRTASFFWVGSEADIMGMHPTYWKPYDGKVPYTDRVDQVIRWLKLPEGKAPGLITLYFDEPDGTGHDYGPIDPEMGETVAFLDSILGYLRSEISKLEWSDRINLIVLSDHGMGPISGDRYVYLDQYLKKEWTENVAGSNPVFLIKPAVGCADSIIMALDTVKGIRAWQKEDIPLRLHYGSSPRFPGIVVVADSLWSVETGEPRGHEKKGDHEYQELTARGTHGYDNAYTAMHTIFLAEGPAFKVGYKRSPFSNVEVYNIVARILELDPAANDGALENVKDIFRTLPGKD